MYSVARHHFDLPFLFPRPDALSYILITIPYAQPFLAVLALSLNPDLTKTPAFRINIINTHEIYTNAPISVFKNENKYEFNCSKQENPHWLPCFFRK